MHLKRRCHSHKKALKYAENHTNWFGRFEDMSNQT